MNIYNIDYRMLYSVRQHLWPVLCQKLWHYSNMCINNGYFLNKLSTCEFQNIFIVIHYNSILNEILFVILHLHIITWKWQWQGPLFQVRRGHKEFLKRHCKHVLYAYHSPYPIGYRPIRSANLRKKQHHKCMWCWNTRSFYYQHTLWTFVK
jgi:hypothetical protein